MSEWKSLVAASVLGSERQQLPQFSSSSASLSAVLNGICTDDKRTKEEKFLALAAVLSVHAAAGTVAQKSLNTPPLIKVDESDDGWIECNKKSADQLAAIMWAKSETGLLPDWIACAVKNKRLAPASLLPRLLDLATRKDELAANIMLVAGSSGRSLAALNPDWLSLVGQIEVALPADLDKAWQTGLTEERIALLHTLRRVDPTEAVRLVQSTWTEENFKDKQAFVETFTTNLSMNDEPFLEEKVLADGRKEVRSEARNLLCRLGESRFSLRMIERASSMVQLANNDFSLQVPAAYDKSMQKDGIEQKSSDPKLGDKQFWLWQIISFINPSHWCNAFNKPALELLNIAGKSKDWSYLLLDAWLTAAAFHETKEWCLAFFEIAGSLPESEFARLEELIPYLSSEEQEQVMLKLMQSTKGFLAGGAEGKDAIMVALLEKIPPAWSEPFTRVMLETVKKEMLLPSVLPWHVAATIRLIGLRGNTELFSELDGRWDTKSKSWPQIAESVDQAIGIMRERRDIIITMNS